MQLLHPIYCLEFWKKIFLLDMIKNVICFGSVSKQNAFFPKNVPQITQLCPQQVMCLEINTDKWNTQWVQIMQRNMHRNKGIKTNSWAFILMIHWLHNQLAVCMYFFQKLRTFLRWLNDCGLRTVPTLCIY